MNRRQVLSTHKYTTVVFPHFIFYIDTYIIETARESIVILGRKKKLYILYPKTGERTSEKSTRK